jgi:hypothetical protein
VSPSRIELREVLVAGHDDGAMAGRAQPRRDRADDVVGLVRRAPELGEPSRRQSSRHSANWRFSSGRRRLAVRLVRGIDRVPERARQRFVEGDRDMLRPRFLEQVAEEAANPYSALTGWPSPSVISRPTE